MIGLGPRVVALAIILRTTPRSTLRRSHRRHDALDADARDTYLVSRRRHKSEVSEPYLKRAQLIVAEFEAAATGSGN